MKLREITIQNFRGLERIHFLLNSHANVIVGPNAVGKSTILEAIRLAKAVLAPRTQNETATVLQHLGASSPHMPQQIDIGALTQNVLSPLQIYCVYELADSEFAEIVILTPQIAQRHVASGMGGSGNNPLLLTQFLSSHQGQIVFQNAVNVCRSYLTTLARTKQIKLNLTIDTATGIRGDDLLAQLIFATLEGRLPAQETILGYFPADRALPFGEVQIQLGLADAVQQLESHIAQPQLKYQRFKTTIANTVLSGDAGRKALSDIFGDVFANILPGKVLGELGINAFSGISIPIIDIETTRSFNLDQMSSGEKGLLLGALLIVRSIGRGGIVLLDEPELHLNPSVCRKMFNYLIDTILVPNDIQAIICTHSAEILDEAIERENCALFHLRSEDVISPIDWREWLIALSQVGRDMVSCLDGYE